MRDLLLASFALSVTFGCVEREDDGTFEPIETSSCADGKCDGSTSGIACYVSAAEPGSYQLASPPPNIKTLFDRWLTEASATDVAVKEQRANLHIEKVIATSPTVVFQATASRVQDQCAKPKIYSWVVFHDGTRFQWQSGRVEFPIAGSYFINQSAHATDPCYYARDPVKPKRYSLRDGTGALIRTALFDPHVKFHRVTDDVALAQSLDTSHCDPDSPAATLCSLVNDGKRVTTVIRPTGLFRQEDLPLACDGYRGALW